MIILDASALVELLLHTSTGESVTDCIDDPTVSLHVPHLADIEVAQVLRRYVRAGEIDADTAATALDDLGTLDLRRHSHEPLLARIWELRHNLTAYDAAYVALAEVLNGILLTCDGPLSRAPGLTCQVRLLRAKPELP